MVDSVDQLTQLEDQIWQEAAAAVEGALTPKWQSAQATVEKKGDLPGQLTTAIAELNVNLRSIAARFAALAGRGKLDLAELTAEYLAEPDTTTLAALAAYVLAVSGGETGTIESDLRQQLIAQLPSTAEDGAQTSPEVDQDAWLQILFFAMDAEADVPDDEWLASAEAYFVQRVERFKVETPKWAAMKGVQRKERFESELSSREKAVYESSDYLQSSEGVALAPGSAEEPPPRRVPTWAIVTGGVLLLLLIAAGISFVTGVIPLPLGTPEATASVAETTEDSAADDEDGPVINAQPTEVVAVAETLEPTTPPTPEPQGRLQTGQGWLCAAGTEWRQLMTVANDGDMATTYTVASLTGGQLGGQVVALPASPGDCSPTGEQAPEIAVDPQTESELLLVFPIPPEGASDLKAELRVAGGEAALSTLDLPAPQALAVSLTRPDNEPDTYIWKEGQTVEVPFLMRANSPGDYELVCTVQDSGLRSEPTNVVVIAAGEPVETACTINLEQLLEEAGNWQAAVNRPVFDAEESIAVELDGGSAVSFLVEPVSYELDAQPGMHLGVRWIDADANNNNQVAIVQVYELRNLGNEPYEIEGIATYESGVSSSDDGDSWGVIDIRYITLIDGSVPLTGTMTIVSEEPSAITLRDEQGVEHRFESQPFTADGAETRVDLPDLLPCPVDESGDIVDTPGLCPLQLAVWFNTWDLREITQDQPVHYRMQFRPLPNSNDRDLVPAMEPLETTITEGVSEIDNPERVIEGNIEGN